MKNIKKIFSLVMVILLMVTMTSCGKKKVSLTKAFENTAKINSYKFKSDINLGINSPDMPAETSEILEGLDINIAGAMKRNTVNDAQIKSDISFTFQGLSIKLAAFYDLEFNKDDFKYNLFIEIPEILKKDPMLGQLFQGKTFAFLGLDKKALVEELNITNADDEKSIPETSDLKKYGESLNKFLKDYYEKNKDTLSKYVEETEFQLNDEIVKLPSYEVNLSNDDIKALFKAYLENDDNINAILDFAKSISKEGIDEINSKEEIDAAIEEIENMPNIIAEDGIKITFAIQDDIIVKQIFDINLLIEGSTISYKVTLDTYDINEPVEIEFPDQNGEDILNLLDLSKMFGM